MINPPTAVGGFCLDLEKAGVLCLTENYVIINRMLPGKERDFVVYLDNSATTAVCAAAIQRMAHVMSEQFGNPSSLHTLGIIAQREVIKARGEVAALIGAKPEQVTFVSGGTEANNLGILGGAAAYSRQPHVAVTTAIEHPSVAACFDALEKDGWKIVRVKPEADGTVTPEAIERACTADTTLVSVMTVNNETGARMDIPTMVTRVKRIAPRALFHTDAVQAAGKLPLRAEKWGVDLLSVSGHKLHAPKGIGALYIRKGVRVLPRVLGGGQENNLRSGTEPTPAIAGFGAAAAEIPSFAEQETQYEALRAALIKGLSDHPDVRFHLPNGGVPYIVNLSLVGFRSETLLHFLAQRGIFVSGGSACAKGKHSAVLHAMGLPMAEIDSSLRISFCRDNTTADVEALCKALREAASSLQRRQSV